MNLSKKSMLLNSSLYLFKRYGVTGFDLFDLRNRTVDGHRISLMRQQGKSSVFRVSGSGVKDRQRQTDN